MADSETGQPKRIEFVFRQDANYKLYAANGVWGGVTTRSDFRMDFFVEHQKNPDGISFDIIGSELTNEKRTPPSSEPTHLRTVQFGVLMSIDQAESMAAFITQQIASFRKNHKTFDTKKQPTGGDSNESS